MKRLSEQIITLIHYYSKNKCNIITLDVLESGPDLSVCIGSDCAPTAQENLPINVNGFEGIIVDYKSDEDLGNSILFTLKTAGNDQLKHQELIDIYVAMMKECSNCELNIHRKKNTQKYSVSCKELNALYSELDSQQLDEQLKKHFTALEERLI